MKKNLALALFILGIATFFRFYKLTTLPGGLNGDELFNAIDALKIGVDGFPVYFEGNNGREVAYHYLLAASLRIFGTNTFAMRLPSALLGVGVVGAVMLLGRAFFGTRIALLAGFLCAIHITPIMQSRWSLRAIMLPFVCALSLYFFHKVILTQRHRDAEKKTLHATRNTLLAGLLLGLSAYTYIPARAFPLVIVGWLIALLLWDRPAVSQKWREILLAIVVALLIFLPFGIYIMQNPDLVNQRVNALGMSQPDTPSPIPFLPFLSNVLGMFTFGWDDDWRYHIADRPFFDWVQGLFFYAGVVVAGWRMVTAERKQRATYALVLLWLGGMLSPNLFAPVGHSSLRVAGALPPIFLLLAVGVDALLTRLPKRAVTPTLAIFLLLVSALSTRLFFIEYAQRWATHPENIESWNTELPQLLSNIPSDPNARIFLPYEYVYDYPTQIAVSAYTNRPVSLVDRATFAWNPTQDSYILETTGSSPLPNLTPPPQFALYQTFENAPTLFGYDVTETLQSDTTIPISLHWEIPALPPQANNLLYANLTLETSDGQIWQTASKLLGYPQASWQTNDRFIETIDLEIPAGMPPGEAFFRVSLSTADGRPLTTDDVRSEAHLIRGLISETRPDLSPNALIFEETIALEASTLSTLISPGLPIDMALDWVVLDTPKSDLDLTLSLISPTGETLLSQTAPLTAGTYSAAQWQANERVRTQHRLIIPLDLPTDQGDPKLVIAFRDLDVTSGDPAIAQMTLDLRARLYELPAIQTAVSAQWEDGVALRGYDLAQSENDLTVTLYWQTEGTPSKNYTVFTHLLRPDGSLFAQLDSPPQSEAWLMTTWLPDEIVIDRRVIPLPEPISEPLTVVVGFYDDTVTRLPLTPTQPNDQLILTEVTP